MHARRDDPAIPAWSFDQLDSSQPPESDPPYFDTSLGAWVLSHHADVLAAFRASSLAPASSDSRKPPEPLDEPARLQMRTETMEALAPAKLRAWRQQLTSEADSQAESLPMSKPIDLIAEYAKPLCLSLAAMVTGISREVAADLSGLARQVSAAASEPYDANLRAAAKLADAELRSHFHSEIASLRDSGFVALSQTMPCILGNAWFALMQHPIQWTLLHQSPERIEEAIDELLRYAGLVRILSRSATEDLQLNGTNIRKGDRILLRIVAANRDAQRFSCPHEVDILRHEGGHLALGAGSHACVGASLIRMSAAVITLSLVQRFKSATPAGPVEWQGGTVFRSPASLWVSLEGD
jgi:cytochrome P450